MKHFKLFLFTGLIIAVSPTVVPISTVFAQDVPRTSPAVENQTVSPIYFNNDSHLSGSFSEDGISHNFVIKQSGNEYNLLIDGETVLTIDDNDSQILPTTPTGVS